MLSVEQLRETFTRTQVLDTLLEVMQAVGFQTTAWQPGRIQHTLVKLPATVISDLSEVAKDLVEFGFNEYATGVGLTLFSKSRYDNDRILAVPAAGPAKLTSTALSPYTIEVGQLIATTANGEQFRNTTGGTLNAGSTLVLQWEARVAGSDGNVANSAINALVTPLAGVTIENNEQTPWYDTAGADEEADETLRERNRTSWALLALEQVGDVYRNLALTNGAAKVELYDDNPRGPATLDVVCAGPAALLGSSVLTTIQAAMATRAFKTETSYPATDDSRVKVINPTVQALDLTATIYHDGSQSDAATALAAEALLDAMLALLPLGGNDYTPGPANVITLEDLSDALKNLTGLKTVVFTTPSSSVSVTPKALVTKGTWSITAVTVTS